MNNKYGVSVCGDMLWIEWDGSIWNDRETGAQYSYRQDGLRDVLIRHLHGCGIREPEQSRLIREYLDVADYFD